MVPFAGVPKWVPIFEPQPLVLFGSGQGCRFSRTGLTHAWLSTFVSGNRPDLLGPLQPSRIRPEGEPHLDPSRESAACLRRPLALGVNNGPPMLCMAPIWLQPHKLCLPGLIWRDLTQTMVPVV